MEYRKLKETYVSRHLVHIHSLRNINEWNKLFTDHVHANSANMFKNGIDEYLRSKGPWGVGGGLLSQKKTLRRCTVQCY